MRKLKAIDTSCEDFAKDIISVTAEWLQPVYTAIQGKLKYLHDDYDDKFQHDNLQNVSKSGLSAGELSRYGKLYKADCDAIQKLKFQVLKNEMGIYDNICPICGIGPANTIDHFVPEGDYPEYCIHPRNLIPLCNDCNGPKRSLLKTDTNERALWNNYLDISPDRQFLFCDVAMIEDMPRANFYIDNRNGIDKKDYSRIERTFERMHVLKHYNGSSSGKAYHYIKVLASHEIYGEGEVKVWLREEINGKDINDFMAVYLDALISSTECMRWIIDKLSELHSIIVR